MLPKAIYTSWLTPLTAAIMRRGGCPTMLPRSQSLTGISLKIFLQVMWWICHQVKNTGLYGVKGHGVMERGLHAVVVKGLRWSHLKHLPLPRILIRYFLF